MMSFFMAMFLSIYPMDPVDGSFHRKDRFTVPQGGTTGRACQCG